MPLHIVSLHVWPAVWVSSRPVAGNFFRLLTAAIRFAHLPWQILCGIAHVMGFQAQFRLRCRLFLIWEHPAHGEMRVEPGFANRLGHLAGGRLHGNWAVPALPRIVVEISPLHKYLLLPNI